jgi:purine-binding chemotaxis protein CheW
MSPRAFCTFGLGGMLYGVEAGSVIEVLRGPEVTRLPLAPPLVRGLVNLRGRIVPVIELRRCLGFEDRAGRERPVHVVVQHGGEAASLMVDAAGDVITTRATLEPPPGTLRGPSRDMLAGAIPLPGCLLHVLDLGRVFAAAAAPTSGGTDR